MGITRALACPVWHSRQTPERGIHSASVNESVCWRNESRAPNFHLRTRKLSCVTRVTFLTYVTLQRQRQPSVSIRVDPWLNPVVLFSFRWGAPSFPFGEQFLEGGDRIRVHLRPSVVKFGRPVSFLCGAATPLAEY